MAAAVDRLLRAIEQKERILLYGDYDADGTSAVVILMKGLELAGGHATFPRSASSARRLRNAQRSGGGSGGVRRQADCQRGHGNSRQRGGAPRIRAGHRRHRHRSSSSAKSELPPAVAVLNPNRPDCTYPEKNLCGAGVAFKLIDALTSRLGWEASRRERLLDSLLKLVAIATVADVVPLTGENRVIVKRGLEGLRHVTNPGLRALLDVSGFADGRFAQRGSGCLPRSPAHQRRRPHGQRHRCDRDVSDLRRGARARSGREASRPEPGPPADRSRDHSRRSSSSASRSR